MNQQQNDLAAELARRAAAKDAETKHDPKTGRFTEGQAVSVNKRYVPQGASEKGHVTSSHNDYHTVKHNSGHSAIYHESDLSPTDEDEDEEDQT